MCTSLRTDGVHQTETSNLRQIRPESLVNLMRNKQCGKKRTTKQLWVDQKCSFLSSLSLLPLSRHHDPGGIEFQHRAQSGCGCVVHPCSNLWGCSLPAGKHGHIHCKSTMSRSISRSRACEFLTCLLLPIINLTNSRRLNAPVTLWTFELWRCCVWNIWLCWHLVDVLWQSHATRMS